MRNGWRRGPGANDACPTVPTSKAKGRNERMELKGVAVARGGPTYSLCLSSPTLRAAEGPGGAFELGSWWHSAESKSDGVW